MKKFWLTTIRVNCTKNLDRKAVKLVCSSVSIPKDMDTDERHLLARVNCLVRKSLKLRWGFYLSLLKRSGYGLWKSNVRSHCRSYHHAFRIPDNNALKCFYPQREWIALGRASSGSCGGLPEAERNTTLSPTATRPGFNCYQYRNCCRNCSPLYFWSPVNELRLKHTYHLFSV